MAHSMWCHGFCQSDKRNSDQSHASPCVCQKYKHACCQEVIPPEASGLLSCKRLVAVQEFWFLYEHKGHIVAWEIYILLYYHINPPSNFSYEMGRTWATVQIASQHFFVQTWGVVPPILYLESFCSWFLSNHAFSFCSCICWVSWSIQHKISLAFCSCTSWIVEASNIKSHLHFAFEEVRRGGKKETVRDMYMDTNRSWSYRMPSNKLHGVNTWSN